MTLLFFSSYDTNDGLRWSEKIMSLTHSNIKWYNEVYDGVTIIDRCGEFPNVPLLGTKWCINYNMILTRHQFGYLIKDKPSNILLSGFFLKEGEYNKAFKGNIIQA